MQTQGVKLIALLRGRRDMSRDAVISYYETHHVPLILKLFPTITAYRRNYADFSGAYVYPEAAPFDFDIVTEIEFAERAAYEAMAARAADPAVLAQIAADEENFLESKFTRMFSVTCRTTPA